MVFKHLRKIIHAGRELRKHHLIRERVKLERGKSHERIAEARSAAKRERAREKLREKKNRLKRLFAARADEIKKKRLLERVRAHLAQKREKNNKVSKAFPPSASFS